MAHLQRLRMPSILSASLIRPDEVAASGWRRLFACRLCWRITLAVFSLILVVETAILVPSAMRFRESELHRLAAIAETAVESLLALGTPDRSHLENGFNALVGQMHVAGLTAFLPDGSPMLTAGKPVRASVNPRDEALGTLPLRRTAGRPLLPLLRCGS